MRERSWQVPVFWFVTAVVAAWPDAAAAAAVFDGSWQGESLCYGDHPACKDEIVIYRFIPDAATNTVVFLADKIVDGARLAMGGFRCRPGPRGDQLECEFTVRSTHGVWKVRIKGDTLEGMLDLLPEHEVVRLISAHRVDEQTLPPAPAMSEYGLE